MQRNCVQIHLNGFFLEPGTCSPLLLSAQLLPARSSLSAASLWGSRCDQGYGLGFPNPMRSESTVPSRSSLMHFAQCNLVKVYISHWKIPRLHLSAGLATGSVTSNASTEANMWLWNTGKAVKAIGRLRLANSGLPIAINIKLCEGFPDQILYLLLTCTSNKKLHCR